VTRGDGFRVMTQNVKTMVIPLELKGVFPMVIFEVKLFYHLGLNQDLIEIGETPYSNPQYRFW
jgi:DNA ligase (NAD+)